VSARVIDHPLEERGADSAFQRAERGLATHPFGDLALAVGAAFAAGAADLGYRSHVDGMVELPVAAAGEPEYDPVAGGDLDGGGAVVGGEPAAGASEFVEASVRSLIADAS
jgi:hypothetical protein